MKAKTRSYYVTWQIGSNIESWDYHCIDLIIPQHDHARNLSRSGYIYKQIIDDIASDTEIWDVKEDIRIINICTLT